MNEELFRSRLETAGLQQFVEELVALNRPAIRLRTEPIGDGADVGGSRLGGLPDLPSEREWPVWKGRPLSFVAQIALAHVSPFNADGLLPSDGALSFFYDPAQEAWGFDPEHKGGSRVWYFGPDIALEHRPLPDELSEYERFEARGLRPESELAH